MSSPPPTLRVAMIGDLDGLHTRSWIDGVRARGHDVHAVSYYPPAIPLETASVTALRRARPLSPGVGAGNAARARHVTDRAPRGLVRIANAVRYRRAGLARAVAALHPDLIHAHFVVEHAWYAAFCGLKPLVITAWGSDILVEPRRDPVSHLIARWTLRRAAAITSNNARMAEEAVRLGAPSGCTHVITLGAGRAFLEAGADSVNLRPSDASRAPTVLSTRAHEPLYNVAEIIDAYGLLARRMSGARLVVAHRGSLTAELQRRAGHLPGRVEFVGFLAESDLRARMVEADVFASVPSSDGTSVALLQAMAAGCFPVVSDLGTQREWIGDGINGFVVPLHRPGALAERLATALADAPLRRAAALHNRALVGQRGLTDVEMAKLDGVYAAVAGSRL